MKSNFFKALVLAIILAIPFSCNKENVIPTTTNIKNSENSARVEERKEFRQGKITITIEDNLLKFENYASFEACLDLLASNNSYVKNNDFKDWLQNNKFNSLNKIFRASQKEEKKLLEEKVKSSSEMELKKINRASFLGKIGKENAKYLTKNKDGRVLPNVPHLSQSYLLDSKGMVKIGNHIVQYSENKFRAITDGDLSKIELLETATQSIPSLNIFVSEIGYLSTNPNKSKGGRTEITGGSYYAVPPKTSDDGEYRMSCFDKFVYTIYPNGEISGRWTVAVFMDEEWCWFGFLGCGWDPYNGFYPASFVANYRHNMNGGAITPYTFTASYSFEPFEEFVLGSGSFLPTLSYYNDGISVSGKGIVCSW